MSWPMRTLSLSCHRRKIAAVACGRTRDLTLAHLGKLDCGVSMILSTGKRQQSPTRSGNTTRRSDRRRKKTKCLRKRGLQQSNDRRRHGASMRKQTQKKTKTRMAQASTLWIWLQYARQFARATGARWPACSTLATAETRAFTPVVCLNALLLVPHRLARQCRPRPCGRPVCQSRRTILRPDCLVRLATTSGGTARRSESGRS
mmetsp:Transcript_6018/g.15346  ORF Transcript_6018/g.15346 Transcript_6018/m.15346 type:complete len:203 (+) Transcript_6018:1551-2159(+)